LGTVVIKEREYESGGSIIHNSNLFMLNYLEICNLKKKVPLATETFSILGDHGTIFQETGYSLLDNARLLWKYGPLQLIKLEQFYKSVLKDFVKIYDLLDEGHRYNNTIDVLSAMSPDHWLVNLSLTTLADYLLLEVGLRKELVGDIVSAATKFNYGQLPTSLHAFVGAVALIGFDKQLWAVHGGNYKVAECALRLSQAKLNPTEVEKVTRDDSGIQSKFRINDDEDEYDLVVIATPFIKDKSNIQVTIKDSPVNDYPYHRTIATMVQGQLNTTSLGVTDDDLSTTHYFHLSPNFPVWSVERMTPVDYNPDQDDDLSPVYRLFSHQPVSEETIKNLFTSFTTVNVSDWLAYPDYNLDEHIPDFMLINGLYYVNGIEIAASAMEMSVLGARNVVNLIKTDIKYKSKTGPVSHSPKTEL